MILFYTLRSLLLVYLQMVQLYEDLCIAPAPTWQIHGSIMVNSFLNLYVCDSSLIFLIVDCLIMYGLHGIIDSLLGIKYD